jgi:hypothetical protein
MALGLVDDAKMRRDSAGIDARRGPLPAGSCRMTAQAGQASSPLRHLTTMAALAKHINASVLDGATCVAFRTFQYVV